MREICRSSPQLLSSASGGDESAVAQVEVVSRLSSCSCAASADGVQAEDSFVGDSAVAEAAAEAGTVE